MNNKNKISFDEYKAIVNKVVDDCFLDDTYSPVNYELSLRTALLIAFAPDYKLSDCKDNNTLWERVTSEKATDILNREEIKESKQLIEKSIRDSIDYRIRILSSVSMSMSDISLSKLFDTIATKLGEIDVSVLDKKDLESLKKVVSTTQEDKFVENLVNTMLKRGVLTKSNNKPRRIKSKTYTK